MKKARGFTMVELVMVMVLIGVVAAIGVPRLMGDNAFAAAAFGDEVASALRSAQKTAVSHRRLVCVTVGATSVTLTMAELPGAVSCTIALGGGYATSAGGVTASAHTLFFQPNGLITAAATGRATTRGNVTISLNGKPQRSIQFEGSTGYVQ